MVFSLVLFAVGFIFLVYGANNLIKGASSVAKKAGLSNLFIGLTIVSFGTTMPEFVTSFFATLQGNFDIAVGNIVGSNISNILLILGAASIIYPLTVSKSTVRREIPYNFLAVFVLFLLANDFLFADKNFSKLFLSRGNGLIMLIFFGIFIYYAFINRRVSGSSEGVKVKAYSYPMSVLLIGSGIILLAAGGQLAVRGAVGIASALGVSQAFIGLTVVAVGTSLPELFTATTAAFKKNCDIAIGNILVANIFNIFGTLGFSSLIWPIEFSRFLNYDIFILMAVTIILLAFVSFGKRKILQRWQGVTMLGLYVTYIIYLVNRG